MPKPSIVWFRQDLRQEDNPALTAAIEKGGPIVPVYIYAPDEDGRWAPGAATRWWLHHALADLQKQLPALVLRAGVSLDNLRQIAAETGADAIYWNRLYEPAAIARDTKVKAALAKDGCTVKSYNGNLLFEPWTILNKQKKSFQVFTPFWKACLAEGEPAAPLPAPGRFAQHKPSTASLKADDFGLLPKTHWDAGMSKAWTPGEAAARKVLQSFLPRVDSYLSDRDIPATEGVSRLSPYLHFGETSPRIIWQAVRKSGCKQGEAFLRQLGWREFAHHLLYHFPKTPEAPLRDNYLAFPWVGDNDGLAAWQKGATGYPIVDAGMRQLWETGWMHNRVRMIVGSFLVKDLLITWREGAKWFWDTLVDADLANNTMGWQWIGGCGADAAPYFRIFNPITQGEKFDPDGAYVRRWVPELKSLPAKWIHKPWEAPPLELRLAGVTLGDNYPFPIVDHAEARDRALAAFASIKSGSD